MSKFDDKLREYKDLSESAQKQAGKAIAGDMKIDHANFLKTMIGLLDKGDIVASDPQSFLKKDVYDALSEEWKDKVNLSLINIAEQIRLIENFYRSEKTPNSSPHLETMIEHLWQMKERIEKEHDVFKF
jgi:hypothetical protein